MTDEAAPPSPTKFGEHPHQGCQIIPYYYVECADCGNTPGDECAFSDPNEATERAMDNDYDFYDGAWHCPKCSKLPK